MNMKTMEGLVGARTNINLSDTAMSVYREASRKGIPPPWNGRLDMPAR